MPKTRWLHDATYVFATLPAWKKGLMGVASLFLFSGLGLKGAGSLVRGGGGSVASAVGSARAGEDARSAEGEEADPGSRFRLESAGAPAAKPQGDGEAVRGWGGSNLRPEDGRTRGADIAGRSRLGDERPPGTSERSPESRLLFPREDRLPGGTRTDRPGDGPGAGVGDSVFDEWAPSLMKGGFSFFAAFCIGYALRAFAKLSLVVAGSIFLTLSGLAYGGYIEVHWDRLAEQFQSLADGLRSGAGSFKSFLQGSLPSAAMCGLGLFAGLKKK